MEIDEVAARLARGYWLLLLALTAVPMVLAGVLLSAQPVQHTATTRINSGGQSSDADTGDAGVSIVVSQVKAFSTNRALLDRVLAEQRIARRSAAIAKKIEVTGLGTSTMVEMSVSDRDPRVAGALTDSIAKAVVVEINKANQGALTGQIAHLDKLIKDSGRALTKVTRESTFDPTDVSAANEKDRLAGELADLRESRRELTGRLATAGTAQVVQPAVPEPVRDPALMLTIVAGLLGLVAGVLIAVVLESLRPTVPGPQRVAKRLGVPLLGHADRGPAEIADLGRRIRLAAKNAGVRQVTLVGTGKRPPPARLVSRIAAAVYGDEVRPVHVTPPATHPVPSSPAATSSPTAPYSPGGDGGGGGDTGVESTETAPDHTGFGAESGSGESVVRAATGTAVRTGGPVAERPSRNGSAPGRTLCHVHAFEDIDPGADDVVGLVAVAGPTTRLSALQSVQDLVTASGWPLLGIIAASRNPKE